MGDSRRTRPNPLARRAVSTGAAGLALAAAALFGAGVAHADTLVVDNPLAVVDAAPGQQIAVSPGTLDFKVREAVLLAMPLAFGPAKDAAERFAELPPIPIGTAEEGRTFYSGHDIAEAARSRLAQIGLPANKVDAVTWHFTNLVSLGNALTVHAERAAPTPPPSHPAPEPTPAPGSRSTPPPAPSDPPAAEPPAPPVVAVPESSAGAPGAVSFLPPRVASLPGSLPLWADARYGEVPGFQPDIGDLQKQARERAERQRQQEEVRAAGQAEALPADVNRRVALPVLLAAVSIAALTAALIRTWILRRQ